jgi:hypothetical protein
MRLVYVYDRKALEKPDQAGAWSSPKNWAGGIASLWQQLLMKLVHFDSRLLRLQTTNNTPDKPCTTHHPRPTQTVSRRTREQELELQPQLCRSGGRHDHSTTNHQRPSHGYSTTTSRQKIARTCTSIARRSAGIDNSKILGFTDRTKNLPVS